MLVLLVGVDRIGLLTALPWRVPLVVQVVPVALVSVLRDTLETWAGVVELGMAAHVLLWDVQVIRLVVIVHACVMRVTMELLLGILLHKLIKEIVLRWFVLPIRRATQVVRVIVMSLEMLVLLVGVDPIGLLTALR